MKLLSTLAALAILFLGTTSRAANVLRPFTSDGCSRFFDGIPYFANDLWLDCCVRHDVAYWRGGTADQRRKADDELRECVTAKAGAAVGKLMYWGVRSGGHPSIPATWHWGYGWTIDRGYGELTEEESAQVDGRMKSIPADPRAVALSSPPILETRGSLTDDYCLDQSLTAIERLHGREFRVARKTVASKKTSLGAERTYSVWIDGCEAPFRASFLVLKEAACTTPMNELAARGRIRLLRLEEAPGCR